ncbi:MAG: hypothetical protein [Caudoviricetes sp.]|nr:MAG: hypothetical protein [Caudoviricetes sp.]
MNKTIDIIIETMQPNMADYADNAMFYHWMDYACELDELAILNFKGEELLVAHLNKQMAGLASSRPEHEACVDVASSIETLIPQFAGRFVYE